MKTDTIVKIHSIPSGKLECTTKNVTTLGGRIAMQSIFKGGSSFQPDIHRTLTQILKDASNSEDEFQNPTESLCPDTTNIEDYINRKIEYFCIGTGGIENSAPLILSKPRNHETRLYNMVPFRCIKEGVESDLTETEREKYRLRRRKKINGEWYIVYYLKKFEIGNIVVQESNGSPYIIRDAHSNPVTSYGDHELKDTSIHAFYEFFLYIDPEDFKEYYKAVNGSLNSEAKLTEFGLVMANEMKNIVIGSGSEAITINELYNAELYSKVVHEPSYMTSENSAKRVTYSIFSL
jgi:hypothetical protein